MKLVDKLNKEDAQLYAAAPKLLEFAKEIRIICKRILVGRSDGFDIKELKQMAEDVINKASIDNTDQVL